MTFMEKLFNEWNIEKQKTDARWFVHAKAWQIWHCKLWVNIWSEENWKWWFLRPILVLWNVGNMLLVAPTTTNIQKNGSQFYYKIESVGFGLRENGTIIESFVMLSQVRTIDSRRLIKHKYTVSQDELLKIKKSLISFLI